MALEVEEYTGPEENLATRNRGKAPSAESVALRAALDKAAATGKMIAVKGVTKEDFPAYSKRVRGWATEDGLSCHIREDRETGSMVIKAEPMKPPEPEPVSEPEPAPTPTPAPAKATKRAPRKAANATR